MSGFISVPAIEVGGALRVHDRTTDLGTVIVYLSEAGSACVHVDDLLTARALKEAFAEAERLHQAALTAGEMEALPPAQDGGQ